MQMQLLFSLQKKKKKNENGKAVEDNAGMLFKHAGFTPLGRVKV